MDATVFGPIMLSLSESILDNYFQLVPVADHVSQYATARTKATTLEDAINADPQVLVDIQNAISALEPDVVSVANALLEKSTTINTSLGNDGFLEVPEATSSYSKTIQIMKKGGVNMPGYPKVNSYPSAHLQGADYE